jgi:hypothetical protein
VSTTTAEIWTEVDAVAALYVLSAAFVAVIAQLPADTADKVVPDTVQIEVVVDVKETDPVPEPPVVASGAVLPTLNGEIALMENADWFISVTTSGGLGKSKRSPYSIKYPFGRVASDTEAFTSLHTPAEPLIALS